MLDEPLLHVILPQPNTTCILIMAGEAGWTLPTLALTDMDDDLFSIFEFGMNVESLLGCRVAALHSPFFEHKNDEHGHRFVFVLQNLDVAFQPPEGARWLSPDELLDFPLLDDYLRPVLEHYFHEQATGEFPPQRAPWAFPGWQATVFAWIDSQVSANGWRRIGEIELVRKWCITCVMKAPTDAGDLYFKAVPPTFAREVGVTRLLARLQPANIPSIVAYDEAERWLLLRDFGKNLLGDNKEVLNWEQATKDFAALQLSLLAHTDALLELGALDYRLELLPAKFDVLLADEAFLQPDRHITAEEIERLRELSPHVGKLVSEMRLYNLPPTIVHSDFHVWNIVVYDGRIIFFDWTDASVGHPFFDMSSFFNNLSENVFPDQPETVAHLRELYLRQWVQLAPMQTLHKALASGEILGFLHQAVNYQHLLRNIEPAERWTLAYAGYFLKKLLTSLEALEA